MALNNENVSGSDLSLITCILPKVKNILQKFATKSNFVNQMGLAFGENNDYTDLQQAWLKGEFIFPNLEVRTSAELNGANGAFSTTTNTIYLSQEFLLDNQTNISAITSVFLEEYGHFVDRQLNRIDAMGDEGEIFSKLILNNSLNDTELSFLKTENDITSIVLDNQSIEVEQSSSYTGTNLEEFRSGVDELFGKLQTGLDQKVYATQLPLLGDTLATSNDPNIDFFTTLQSAIDNKLNSVNTLTPDSIQKALFDAFKELNLLGDASNLSVDQVIQKNETSDNLSFKFNLTKDTNFNSSLDTDIGLPNLGLTVNGSAEVGLSYDLSLTLGTNKDRGFYLDTSDEKLNLDLNANLKNAQATGKLGFLNIDIKDQGTNFDGGINIDLSDPDNRLYFSELENLDYNNLINTEIKDSNADINLKLVTRFDNSIVLPSLSTDFNFKWDFDENRIDQVNFDNVKLDLNSFFNNFTRPIFEKVQQVTEPVQPIINLLTKPIDLRFTKISLLDVAEKFKYIDDEDKNFIQSLDKFATLINSIPSGSDKKLNLGSFDLGDANILSTELKEATPNVSKNAESYKEQLGNSDEERFISSFDTIPGGGLEFSILKEPTTAFNLLLGKDANLFTYDLPKFDFTANYDRKFIRIYGPFGLTIEGDFGAGIDLAFGYDTQGIQDFGISNDTTDIFNGFYVSDDNGDKSEITLSAGIKAFGGINIYALEGGAGGGINAEIGFDLKDKDGKLRLTELEKYLLSNPLDIFCTSGKLTAGLSAYVTIGIDPVSSTKEWNSPRVTLANYNQPCDDSGSKPKFVLAQEVDGNLRLNMGPNAADRQTFNMVDGAETFSLQHQSGIKGNEKILVSAIFTDENGENPQNYTKEYPAGTKIVANGGIDDDIIEALINQDNLPVETPVNFTGGLGKDILSGGNGDDTLKGGEDFDQLFGNGGNDQLFGDTNNDWLIGGAGADTLDGSNGFDLVSYNSSSEEISLNLATGIHTGDAAGDEFISIEQYVGSTFNDTMIGNNEANIFGGGDGNDSLNGGAGDDILNPGWGNDTVDGGAGVDILTLDYSLLPTRAVAWRELNTRNGSSHWDVYVANAFGVGTPLVQYEVDNVNDYSINISEDGTTLLWQDQDSSYRTRLFVQKLDSSKPPQQIYDSLQIGRGAVLSADGSKVAFIGSNNNSYDIFAGNIDGTGLTKIADFSSSPIGTSLALSGDGKKVAWISEANTTGSFPTNIIYVANTDGTEITSITTNEYVLNGLSLNYDGSLIAWNRYNIYIDTEIWVSKTDGTEAREISEARTISNNSYPSISTDGSQVAWRNFSNTGSTGYEIKIVSTDGTNRRTINGSQGALGYPNIAPDGQKVVFAKYLDNGEYGIFVADTYNQGSLFQIDQSSSDSDYGSSSGEGPVISSYVDIGVRYSNFDLTKGDGEIVTWGPSHVEFSNIEQFDITGTIYGDELYGGNLNDTLTGNGGADTLKGALGDDFYQLDVSSVDKNNLPILKAAGSIIEDTGGTDKLQITTYDENNKDSPIIDAIISLSPLANDKIGLKRDNTTLIIDIDRDGVANPKKDISILHFFNTTNTGAGNGFIDSFVRFSKDANNNNESIYLTGSEIINFFNSTNESSVLAFSQPSFVVNENDTVQITVTRTGGSDGIVSATIQFADGTAIAPNDYNNTPINVTFADGDSNPKIITIPIIDDAQFEPNETINLALSNLTGGATLGTQSNVILTIVDNDVPNNAPVAVDDAVTTSTNTAIAITKTELLSNDTDIDNETLVITAVTNPVNGTVTLDGDSILFTPKNGYQGKASFDYTVSDGKGGEDIGTVNVTVNSLLNNPPFLNQPLSDRTILEDKNFGFGIPSNTFKDPDRRDKLTYSATLANGQPLPKWLKFNPKTRFFGGKPSNADVGAIDVQVTARDKSGASASDIFQIAVQNVNDSPYLNQPIGDRVAIEDRAFQLIVPANTFKDVDPQDKLTYSATLANGKPLPQWLSFDSTNLTLSGTPRDANVGVLDLKIAAKDLAGKSAQTQFRLTVFNLVQGTPGADNLRGQDRRDFLTGEASNDTLRGGKGDDILEGGAGDDLMFGEAGKDRFTFSGQEAFNNNNLGVDRIADFQLGDRIALSKTVFKALSTNINSQLIANNFAVINTDSNSEILQAASQSAVIVYNSTTGSLFYNENRNGDGLGDGSKFASIDGAVFLSNNSFSVIQ